MQIDKKIVIIDGVAEGKNLFSELAKEHGYWTWNINHRNSLGKAAEYMGWRGKRDDKYYELVKKLEVIAEEYYGFKSSYTLEKIQAFINHEKASLLLVHRFDLENNKILHDVLKAKFNATTLDILGDGWAYDEAVCPYDHAIKLNVEDNELFRVDVLAVLESAGIYTE